MKLADACRISGVTFYAGGMGAHGYSMSICYKGKWYMTNVYNGIGLSKQGERKIDQFYEDTDDEGGTIKMVPSDFTSEGKVMDAMR